MSTNKEELKSEENAKIENFQEFISDVEKQVNEEIKEASRNDEDLTKKAKLRNGIMNRIWFTLTKQILGKFKVKITLYYNEKIIFEYQIPNE